MDIAQLQQVADVLSYLLQLADDSAIYLERAVARKLVKNALDFHLGFYMGYITSRNPEARFVVISNDQGYGPMLGHAQDLAFATRQVGLGTPTVTAGT